jgi:uncharacterized RDD family membrane protein YckC
MEIWIIRDGIKTGPFPDYEIRHRIESGAIDAGTMVWHEGLESWTPISEVPLYGQHIRSLAAAAPGPPVAMGDRDPGVGEEPTHAAGDDLIAATPLPYRPGFIRRFWARWLDLHVYGAVWWLGLWFAGRDIGESMMNPWLIFTLYVPWFVLEAWLIHRFRVTPGKWLLGIRVLNEDGSNLTLRQAHWRSMRVLTIGIGLGFSFLAVFCQGLSLVTARRLGRPVWDHLGGHQVAGEPLKGWRVVLTVMGFFAAAQLQFAVTGPYEIERAGERFPQIKEHFEKNPPWHLPRR